jgi:hypothetical protein
MKCFVIMPIGDPSNDETSRRFEHIYTHWIKAAVEELPPVSGGTQITCHRADKDNRPGDIITQVIEAISDADIVIADLTGRNPNVFYELGVRHAVRNGTILLAQDIADIPFDLRGQRTICYRYDPESLIALKCQLQATLAEIISGTMQIDNPVRRFLHEREVAKILAAPVSPGYDALRELVSEMNTVRQDLAERVVEIRELVQYSTSSPTREAAPEDDGISAFEGAWTSRENGGLYIVQRVRSEWRGPYCYGGRSELTSHFYNVQIVGKQFLCRFQWFRQPIEGCVILRAIDKDHLAGGWWYIHQLPDGEMTDLRDVHENLPQMNPLHLIRIPLPDPLPGWVRRYFDRVRAGEI